MEEVHVSAPFRAITQDDEDTFDGEANELFALLDSLESQPDEFVLIESVEAADRFVQVAWQDGDYRLEVKQSAAEPLPRY